MAFDGVPIGISDEFLLARLADLFDVVLTSESSSKPYQNRQAS